MRRSITLTIAAIAAACTLGTAAHAAPAARTSFASQANGICSFYYQRILELGPFPGNVTRDVYYYYDQAQLVDLAAGALARVAPPSAARATYAYMIRALHVAAYDLRLAAGKVVALDAYGYLAARIAARHAGHAAAVAATRLGLSACAQF